MAENTPALATLLSGLTAAAALQHDDEEEARYLKFLGYQVTYVRNFTDIDDKIIKRANQNGEAVTSLSSRFINEFHADMAELQCLPLPPTNEPRVTDHIEQIKEFITKIIKNDKGYVVDGNVYFSVDKFPGYYSLSGRKPEDNLAGSRVAVDPRKWNPDADFALWKAAKEGEFSREALGVMEDHDGILNASQ